MLNTFAIVFLKAVFWNGAEEPDLFVVHFYNFVSYSLSIFVSVLHKAYEQ